MKKNGVDHLRTRCISGPTAERDIVCEAADEIDRLTRQLAEAQEARDLNAAALECYSAEQARLRKELAEAREAKDGAALERARAMR